MAYGNLRDAAILRDFTVFLNGVGKIGTVANIQLPELDVQMEEFRGGGMDMAVQIPMGLNKMELSFDLLSWDEDTWAAVGFDAKSMQTKLDFYGVTITANGAEAPVEINVQGGIIAVKNDALSPGKSSKQTVKMSVFKYKHTIGSNVVMNIDAFGKIFYSGANDLASQARGYLHIPGNASTSNTISPSSGVLTV